MCDFSLRAFRSRPAQVADKLTTKNFGYGTTGFVGAENNNTAVCVLPGTEIAFDEPIRWVGPLWARINPFKPRHMLARFRQINKNRADTHHDALELPDGKIIMLTALEEGQTATVLQLPAAPKTAAEAQEQKRVEYVG